MILIMWFFLNSYIILGIQRLLPHHRFMSLVCLIFLVPSVCTDVPTFDASFVFYTSTALVVDILLASSHKMLLLMPLILILSLLFSLIPLMCFRLCLFLHVLPRLLLVLLLFHLFQRFCIVL
ncbi:hypothetical protein Csa_023694 [Cucumis sativus]|nr:hypothetical protein Csa_023694 [Cucumis sativus]